MWSPVVTLLLSMQVVHHPPRRTTTRVVVLVKDWILCWSVKQRTSQMHSLQGYKDSRTKHYGCRTSSRAVLSRCRWEEISNCKLVVFQHLFPYLYLEPLVSILSNLPAFLVLITLILYLVVSVATIISKSSLGLWPLRKVYQHSGLPVDKNDKMCKNLTTHTVPIL